jgi:four helix bundle protein
LKESVYWLSLIRESGLATEKELTSLLNEADELSRITAKSVMTAKSHLR